jgi:hypothetical protein
MRLTSNWQQSAWECRFLSEVIMPTERAISDINRNLKDRQIGIVRKKLDILDKGYQEFRKGGPRPELFLNDLYKITEEGQQLGAR